MPDERKKINTKKLDKYEILLKQLWNIVNELGHSFTGLSHQERVLAGGVVIQTRSYWDKTSISSILGSEDMILGLINDAIKETKQRKNPPPPPPFPMAPPEGKSNLPN